MKSKHAHGNSSIFDCQIKPHLCQYQDRFKLSRPVQTAKLFSGIYIPRFSPNPPGCFQQTLRFPEFFHLPFHALLSSGQGGPLCRHRHYEQALRLGALGAFPVLSLSRRIPCTFFGRFSWFHQNEGGHLQRFSPPGIVLVRSLYEPYCFASVSLGPGGSYYDQGLRCDRSRGIYQVPLFQRSEVRDRKSEIIKTRAQRSDVRKTRD